MRTIHRRPERPRRRAASIGVLAALAVAGGASAQPTDAISREVSVYNRAADVAPVNNAVSREVSMYNVPSAMVHTDAIGREVTVYNAAADLAPVSNAVSREVSVANMFRSVVVTSSDPGTARPVTGSLTAQLASLNTVPPAFDGSWAGVQRRPGGSVSGAPFCAESTPSPLSQPFITVTPGGFLPGVDEVTLDNTRSAFYRFTFDLPCDARNYYSLSGTVNASHQAVAYLNGVRISALMTVPACDPVPPLCNPQSCYTQQDAGRDRVDAQGLPTLTQPTPDGVLAWNQAAFRPLPQTNELVFAVAGDAQALDPTGLQFALAIFQTPRPCPADWNRSGVPPTVQDIFDYLSNYFAGCADFNGNGSTTVQDIFDFLAAYFAGC